jgi:hypothetical protein
MGMTVPSRGHLRPALRPKGGQSRGDFDTHVVLGEKTGLAKFLWPGDSKNSRMIAKGLKVDPQEDLAAE